MLDQAPEYTQHDKQTQGGSGAVCASHPCDVSIVVPLLNEAESLGELASWVDRVVELEGWRAEMVLVDDGSSDDSWRVIRSLRLPHVEVRGIRFQRNYGKAAALHMGFEAARGEVVFTMDADLQDSPDELPALYRMIYEEGYDLVSGWKKVRHDPKLSKNLPSKLYNACVRRFTGIRLHDFNCGLKAYRRPVVKSIELYGDMHRYVPVLAHHAGYRRIGEKVVVHQERKYGVTKFGWSRFINGFLDLLTVLFISRFGKRPMHLFGSLGTLMFVVGGGITLWLIGVKVYSVLRQVTYRQVVDMPLFFIALTLVLLGGMCFLAGFVGELVARNAPERNRYHVADRYEGERGHEVLN